MEQIYTSNTWIIYWHTSSKCLHFVFQEYTKELTEEEYLEELKKFIEITNQYKPKTVFADTREFYFTIVPHIQEYINENILALYVKIGLEKHAILVSPDIFTAVSVEQTMDENQEGGFENRYFESEEEVKSWLNI